MQLDGVGIVTPQQFSFDMGGEGFVLESGDRLPDVTVQYETYGELAPNRDNGILVFHAFSGDAHAAGYHTPEDRRPGWWDELIGPGRAFDTDRYFVICSNVLGGCRGTTGPGSIDPETGRPWGLSFPLVTIADMVRVQKELVTHLGIDRLYAVAGGSMGGMQALEWAVRFPSMVERCIVIAATSRLSAQGIAFNAVGRNAIMSDPNWNRGNYYDGEVPSRGLAVARMIGHITYLSSESMRAKFGRRMQNGDGPVRAFDDQFAVESYLEYQGEKFVEHFDANTYIYLSKAMDHYDLAGEWEGFENAFREVQASFLVLSYSSDWLFTTEQSKEIVYALARAGKEVSFNEINSPYGHDSFLLEYSLQSELISAFLQGSRGR